MTARKMLFCAALGVGVAASGPALAAVTAETAYVFNTFMFLVCGFLVMFMAAGFCMLESGLVRTKNTAAICLKNIALYSTAGIMYYLIGYNLMYVDVSGYIGTFSIFYPIGDAELALLGADEATDALGAAVRLSLIHLRRCPRHAACGCLWSRFARHTRSHRSV